MSENQPPFNLSASQAEKDYAAERQAKAEQLAVRAGELGLLPPPEKNRMFVCSKCYGNVCRSGTQYLKNPPCADCDYLGHADDVGHSDEALLAYAKANLDALGYDAETVSAAQSRSKLKAAGWTMVSHTVHHGASGVTHEIFFTSRSNQVLIGRSDAESAALAQIVAKIESRNKDTEGSKSDAKTTVNTSQLRPQPPYYSTTPGIYHGQTRTPSI